MDHDGDDDDGDDVIGDDGVFCYAGMESLVGSDYRFEDITRWACVFQIVPTMREVHYRANIPAQNRSLIQHPREYDALGQHVTHGKRALDSACVVMHAYCKCMSSSPRNHY